MMDVCGVIVEASRRYAMSVEGLAWDHMLEAAPVLQGYVLRGEAPEGVDDKWAARILWAMLAIWGNVKSLVEARRCCICCLEPWVEEEGAELIKRLKGLRESIERLASLPETPSPDDIERVKDDIEEVYSTVRSARCLGDVAAAKTIAFLTLFHLPPLDKEIAKLLVGREPTSPRVYIDVAKALAKILSVCMQSSVFREYLEERRATGSKIRAKPFKVLDEGLWWLLHRERDEVKSQVYTAIREVLRRA